MIIQKYTTKVNETATKQILHQRKFKKFNTLKQKPKPNVKTTNFTEGNELLDKSPTTARPIYAKILKDLKNPSIKTSKTNLNNSKTKKNIQKKLHSLSPTTRTCKQGNIPSRNNSNANMAKMIAKDLTKQQALDTDTKAIQQINFTRKLSCGRNANATMFFII